MKSLKTISEDLTLQNLNRRHQDNAAWEDVRLDFNAVKVKMGSDVHHIELGQR